MSKILANQIANYLDNAPIEIKEGLNVPTGKPLQVNGSTGTAGQVLSSDGTGLAWTSPPYFSGSYTDLTNQPTIPAAQVNSDWNSTVGVSRILNKPLIPPQSSVTIGPAQGGGDLTYNSTSGEFTFTPPNLSTFSTFSGSYADLSGKPDLSVYLTSFTETDPVFSAAPASGITSTNITNWNSSYSWGNHASAGYITAEADTLATITARGATTTADVTVNDCTVNGDLTVIGTTTSNNQSTLNVAATQIIINDGQTGTPALDGFLKIDRGASADVAIKWSEGSDRWQLTNDGSVYYDIPIATSDLVNDSGYLSSFTETDPVFTSSASFGIGSSDITNWNTAFGWGNHASAGYLTSEADTLDDVVGRGATTSLAATFGDLTCSNLTVSGTTTQINTTQLMVSDNMVMLNTDVSNVPTENAGIFIERGLSTNVGLLWNEGTDRWTFTNDGSTYVNLPTAVGDLSNDAGYITGFTETDPVYLASVAATITTSELSNWNAAYNWGDHASGGYVSGTATDKTNWDTAYGWGDHSLAGYVTAEADTLATVTGRGSSTTSGITLSTSNLILDSANDQRVQHNVSGVEKSKIIWRNTGAVDFYASNGMSFFATSNASPNNRRLQLLTGGGVRLEWQNNTRLETTSLGVDVAGDITTTGRIFYSNNFTDSVDLPNATTYHGMFAHVHNEGHGYFAHAGGWTQLLDTSSSLGDLADVSFASAPSAGQVLKYNGTNWVPDTDNSGGGGGGASVTTDDSAPTSPSDGDLWWKSDEGRLKIYYQDVDTSQWVDASPPLATTSISDSGNSVAVTDNDGSGGVENGIEFGTDNNGSVGVRWRVTTAGHLLPAANDTYDIGSASFKVRDMYVNDGSIHTESGNALSFHDGNLTWGGDDVIMLQDLKNMMLSATSFEDFKNSIMSL